MSFKNNKRHSYIIVCFVVISEFFLPQQVLNHNSDSGLNKCCLVFCAWNENRFQWEDEVIVINKWMGVF